MAELQIQIRYSTGNWYCRWVDEEEERHLILQDMIEREGNGGYRFNLIHPAGNISGVVIDKRICGLI